MGSPLVALVAGWVWLLACGNILAIEKFTVEVRRAFIFGNDLGLKGHLTYDVSIKLELDGRAGQNQVIGQTRELKNVRHANFDESFTFYAR